MSYVVGSLYFSRARVKQPLPFTYPRPIQLPLCWSQRGGCIMIRDKNQTPIFLHCQLNCYQEKRLWSRSEVLWVFWIRGSFCCCCCVWFGFPTSTMWLSWIALGKPFRSEWRSRPKQCYQVACQRAIHQLSLHNRWRMGTSKSHKNIQLLNEEQPTPLNSKSCKEDYTFWSIKFNIILIFNTYIQFNFHRRFVPGGHAVIVI